jgi:hypothetical protein
MKMVITDPTGSVITAIGGLTLDFLCEEKG